jgi:hypothetical protein
MRFYSQRSHTQARIHLKRDCDGGAAMILVVKFGESDCSSILGNSRWVVDGADSNSDLTVKANRNSQYE